MKYFTEDIEFTRSVDYFSEEGFLLDGVCYNNVKDGLVSSLVNCTEVIKSYVCKKFSDDEELEISIPYELYNKKRDILPLMKLVAKGYVIGIILVPLLGIGYLILFITFILKIFAYLKIEK